MTLESMKLPRIGFVPIKDRAAEILSVGRKKGRQVGQLGIAGGSRGGLGVARL
jgi:hypothetical protein